ncbi:5'-methylthioadenosine/S-adenosylhomocysteine nucleosidase [Colletotrichum aenigma]|uniref:5'-methylthioadenosine/S-adenosylhomocysteine nucleosidase n=1 Tax=Colletotrichum aenigma TaxID=1215731 RepID=UPI001872A4DD|nr:5'-methylthioadenosine/S-adenosylhomocysteine nucleosidase [Colletotrichum aenigma]KAF5517472.1 5'-methylthioadenosine/S-adenosylhomocysteine nucleosidase [Colletotrichum aenigma]
MTTQLPGLRRKDFHVAIICAVDCEYDAVIFTFDEIWDGLEFRLGNAPGDHNKYEVGRIANRNAVLLLLTGMGKANAASGAASLRSSYTEIKLAIVTGICGGVPGVGTDKELLLGDVVISKCIVQYDLGRRYADRFATKDAIEDSLGRPHESRKFLDLVCNNTAAHELRVVVGRLGSGDTVMKSGLDRDQVAQEQNLIAFEMKGAGIWDRFPCVVVKAACDYSDSHKNKKFQNFAAARAASAMKAVLEAFPCAGSPSECRQDIFEVLERFYFGEQNHANSSKLKFLITSRPYDDLEMSFETMATAESYIRLDGDDKFEEIRHEIDLVIDHKVREFGKHFREEHHRAISERLKAMENRTYLWLHLTLSIIDEKRSAYRKPSSVQTLPSSLPSSVFDAYEKILSRSQDEEQARNLLNIILAATQPLTLNEINWALTLQAKDFMNQKELEDDIWPRESLKMTVKNLCGLF